MSGAWIDIKRTVDNAAELERRVTSLTMSDVLVGVPAVGGVLIGTWLHRRLANRAISLLFAAVLVASAAELVLR